MESKSEDEIRGEEEMSSTRKEESKSALQVSNKSSQSKTSAWNALLIFDYKRKKKRWKKRKFLSFSLRDEGDVECGGREEEESRVNQPTALLPSRNTSIAPRYILPNARTNIHPTLLITARSSMPLLLLVLLLLLFLHDVYQNQMCSIHCCKAGKFLSQQPLSPNIRLTVWRIAFYLEKRFWLE